MNPTPEHIIKLVSDNQWRLLICAIVIGFIVRLSKGDVPWFPTISSRWRPMLSLLLGVATSVADHIANGTPWKGAIILGLIAGLVPVSAHEVLVNGVRDGKDFPAPLSTPVDPATAKKDAVDVARDVVNAAKETVDAARDAVDAAKSADRAVKNAGGDASSADGVAPAASADGASADGAAKSPDTSETKKETSV